MSVSEPNEWEFDPSMPPEEALATLLLELRAPLNMVEGCSRILEENPQDEHTLSHLIKVSRYIVSVHQKAKTYLDTRESPYRWWE